MRINFSKKITLVCVLLALGMLRMSYWQWQRHLWKQGIIKDLEARISEPVADFNPPSDQQDPAWDLAPYHRYRLHCEFLFEQEMVLRNRRDDNVPGVYLLTPCKLKGSEKIAIVQRGFIPLTYSAPEARKIFQKEREAVFVGLAKASDPQKFMAPNDAPAGPGHPWLDAWLRVDLDSIGKQLPYPILPIYFELVDRTDGVIKEDEVVRSDAGREEIFMMPIGRDPIVSPEAIDPSKYPIPAFNAVVPPGRHLGYVYEWAFMALLTLLAGLVLQFRREK